MVHNANGLKSIRQIVAEVASETVENMPDVTQKKSCKKVLTYGRVPAYNSGVKRYLTVDEVVAIIAKKRGSKTLRAFAEEMGVRHTFIQDVLTGRRNPGPKLLSRLGFKEKKLYERTA